MVVLREQLKEKKSAAGIAKLKTLQEGLRKARALDIKNRTNHYHALVHRLVAEYFVKPKTQRHAIVGHLDHNKMNNKAANLQWMTPEENYAHQQKSPMVIKAKKRRMLHRSK